MRATTSRFARVALPLGLRQTLTYSIPSSLADTLTIGHRVRVPLGARQTHGYVVGFTEESPPGRLRAVTDLDPPEVLFTPEILRLSEWAAGYYLTPWGQMLDAALPPSVRRGGAGRARKAEGVESVEQTIEGEDGARWTLYPEQAAAAAALLSSLDRARYEAFLLHGVTGSGKTEVYLEAAEHVVQAGGSVLFLVPEIALGTQILTRVRRRFRDKVGLYHSQAGEGRRRQVWNQAREGRLQVVLGTRSAVFVPMPDLRLVVIDEEQEGAYKQVETPRYHGRDLAVVRARHAGAVVVLGSATPSLESLHNLERGKYQLLRMSERVDGRPLSPVVLVDLNEGRGSQTAGADRPGRSGGGRRGARMGPVQILSPTLLGRVQDRLDRSEQTILFLNRRGHSSVVQCIDCGQPVNCKHCDVAMTFHKSDGLLRCHYCNALLRGIESCPSCQGNHFLYVGVGTQKVEEILRETFPQARVARMDFDTTRHRGAHAQLIGAMERGEVDILLGTQMVAKGFHFPNVTLVGVVQADREMLQPDFRASERAFQILTQVAGRAGRGEKRGEVVIQSLLVQHHVIACAATGDYLSFAERELEYRRALGYPPFHRMIDLLIDGPKKDQVEARAELIRDALAQALPREALDRGRWGVEVLGPAPMPLARLKGRFRWHMTLKGASAANLHRSAQIALNIPAGPGLSGTRLQVDVDPLSLA
jgi:primosomal protein N' (replication factor Y) (superfamily II helicase)